MEVVMGMPKLKQSQQRFGFMDDDIKKTKHDEIMIWLSENIYYILPNLLNYKEKWDQENINDVKEVYREHKFEIPDIPDKSPLKIISKKWEFPVTVKNKGKTSYVVGFVDFKVKFGFDCLTLPLWQYPNEVRDWDVVSQREGDFLFEVKTKIPSCGELLRQISLYREFIRGGNFCVVSPDDQFREIIESQDISFLKYNAWEFRKTNNIDFAQQNLCQVI